MKKILPFLWMVCFCNSSQAQNIVPNASFEDTLFCPNQFDQLSNAIGWTAFRYTPDYFNACATTLGVPDNSLGFQHAYTGNGYAGFIAFDKFESNAREYAGIKLAQTLQVGNSYFVSLKVSLADDFTRDCACNNLGALFTTSAFTVTNPLPIPNFAHIYSDSIVSDKINWVHIAGTFIADSAYEYLVIGNFFADEFTDTINCASESYMYLDDVCVAKNEEGCIEVGIHETDEYSTHIFPNPADAEVRLKSEKSITAPILLNYQGKVIETEFIQQGRNLIIINTSKVKAGIYFIEVKVDQTIERLRLIITH